MVDARISFKRNAHDEVIGLVPHQNGNHPAARISGVEATKDTTGRSVILLPVATLRDYVGRYRLAPGAVFDVTLKGDQLYIQLTGQSSFPVHVDAEDKFFYTIVNARIDFVRDGKGKVIALVLHQNGTDQRAPKIPD